MLYNRNILMGLSGPNVSSWAVWSFITVLGFTSYRELTNSWLKSLLPTVNSLLCIITTIVVIKSGSFRTIGAVDLICLGIGIFAGLCWWKYRSAGIANILVNAAVSVGFIPTLIGVTRNPSGEPWVCWSLWTAAFIIQFLTVKLSGKKKPIEFLYPISMAIFHGAVFVLALW